MECISARLLFVIIVIFIGFILPFFEALKWGIKKEPDKFIKHRELTQDKYRERIQLLKYFISIGFSVIGATWLLSKDSIEAPYFSLLKWAWIFIGTSLLGAISEIYLTYKDMYYWPILEKEGIKFTIKKYAFTRILYCSATCSETPPRRSSMILQKAGAQPSILPEMMRSKERR